MSLKKKKTIWISQFQMVAFRSLGVFWEFYIQLEWYSNNLLQPKQIAEFIESH